jgi:hypothetical protein
MNIAHGSVHPNPWIARIFRPPTLSACQRLAAILVPLILFAVMAWWAWLDVKSLSDDRADRMSDTLASHAGRVFDVQDELLKAMLARVRGYSPEQIAADPELRNFFLELGGDSRRSITLMLVQPRTRAILAWSRPESAPSSGTTIFKPWKQTPLPWSAMSSRCRSATWLSPRAAAIRATA